MEISVAAYRISNYSLPGNLRVLVVGASEAVLVYRLIVKKIVRILP
jgi:hypothetical protein